MKPRSQVRRRGQPLIALVLVMVSWVGARAALWESSSSVATMPPADPVKANPPKAPVPHQQFPYLARPGAAERIAPPPVAQPTFEAPPAPLAMPTTAPPPLPAPDQLSTEPGAAPSGDRRLPPKVAAGHQELWLAGMNLLPADPALAMAPATSPRSLPLAVATAASSPRWSADGWLLMRSGSNMYNAPGAGLPGAVILAGFYGGSQGGLILRYFLAPGSRMRPALYLRGSSGIESPRGEEVALGFSLRPIAGLPVRLMAEGRVTRTTSGTIIRPAAALVSELPPARLPLGTRAEVYLQGGYVGGRASTAFVDGQARLEKPLLHASSFDLRAGGGVWGGAQRGASRLDVGPTATVSFHLGQVGTRLSADYRWRVAGNAAPGSGPVVTLSAGF